MQPAGVEVDVVDGQAEDLTLSHPTAGPEVDDGTVALRQAGPDEGDVAELPRHHATLDRAWLADRPSDAALRSLLLPSAV
jgi:hypothetical protein